MRWKELMVNSLPRSWTKNRKLRSQQQQQQQRTVTLKHKQLDDNANTNDVTDLCVAKIVRNDVDDLCLVNNDLNDVVDDNDDDRKQTDDEDDDETRDLAELYDVARKNQRVTRQLYKQELDETGNTILKTDFILTNNLNDPKQFKCSCYKHISVLPPDGGVENEKCFFNDLVAEQNAHNITAANSTTVVPKTNPKFSIDSDLEDLNNCVTPKIRTRIKTNPWIPSPKISPNSSEANSCNTSSNSSPTSSLSRSRSASLNKEQLTAALCACVDDTASSTSDLGSEATGSTLDSRSARALKHLSLTSDGSAASVSSTFSDAGFGFSESLDDVTVNTLGARDHHHHLPRDDEEFIDYETEFESLIENVDSPHLGKMTAQGECGSCFSLQRLQVELAVDSRRSTPIRRRNSNRQTYVIDGKILNTAVVDVNAGNSCVFTTDWFLNADNGNKLTSSSDIRARDIRHTSSDVEHETKMNTSVDSDVIERDFEPDSESEDELHYYLDDVDTYTDDDVELERKSANDVIDYDGDVRGVSWLEEYLETEVEGARIDFDAPVSEDDHVVPDLEHSIEDNNMYCVIDDAAEVVDERRSSIATPVRGRRHEQRIVAQVAPRRSIGEIQESLQDKVLKLRQEKLIVEAKLKQAKEEQDMRRQVTAQFQRQVTSHRKQVLMRTLSDLRRRLEGQCSRLQTSYSSVLSVQKNVIRPAKLRQAAKLREAPF
ncbi:uncharacterized protein LOC141909765 [Tubulanus polymorphus]|uniref:uncharacterized protein LOC141909765 n=1 Tax=Tubulanus polymorphus TaxID=672921 RepID=UPI003DA34A5D